MAGPTGSPVAEVSDQDFRDILDATRQFVRTAVVPRELEIMTENRVPDDIRISAHGKEVVQANCIRCHETAVEMIDQKRWCWDCHRRTMHRHVGVPFTR